MTLWQQCDRARAALAREVGYVRKPHGGRLRVALAFPNTYFVGMSNLGFQTVYRLFNALDGVVCERAFLPPKQELRAQLQSGAPIVTLKAPRRGNHWSERRMERVPRIVTGTTGTPASAAATNAPM